jgi:hypothetical protein
VALTPVLRAIYLIALIGIVGCSSRSAFVESGDAGSPAEDFVCAPARSGACSAHVPSSRPSNGTTSDNTKSPNNPSSQNPSDASNDESSDGSNDESSDGLSDTASSESNDKSSDGSSGQDNTSTTDDGRTKETDTTSDGGSDTVRCTGSPERWLQEERECPGPACGIGAQPCPCYVEAACENGDSGCSGVEVWSLTVNAEEFDYLNEHANRDIRIPGTLCADSTLYEFSIEVQGASSRRLPKKNYNLRFDKSNELPGKYLDTEGSIDKLVVKAMATDRTFVRETLSFDLWRAMGHDAPYSGGKDGFVQLVINGRFHGLYSRVEPVDRDYFRRRSMRDDGHLYKGVRKNGGFADFRPGRKIEDAFEDKTNSDSPDYAVLQELLDVIQNTKLSPEEFVDEIAKYLPLDLIMDRMAWVSFTQNGDAVAQNFFLYHLPEQQPPWHLVPWDSNLCFGADWQDPEHFIAADSTYLFGGNLLSERLLQDPTFASAFKTRYSELLSTLFTSHALSAELSELVARLDIAMDRDQALWGYSTDAMTAFEGLFDFLDARPGFVAATLERRWQ